MDFDYCPFGRRNLSAINDKSSIVFSVPTAGDVENPVLFPFNNNYQVEKTLELQRKENIFLIVYNLCRRTATV